MVKYVYLDQNIWIELSRAHYGRSENYKEACEVVIQASETEDVIFPLSIVHINETVKRANIESRKRLADFMIKISKGNAISPWTSLIKPEIRNYLRNRSGQPQIDLKKGVFGIGIPQMLGAKPQLIAKNANAEQIPPDILKKLAKKVYSPDLIHLSMVDENTSKEILKGMNNYSDDDLVKDLEELRVNEYSHPDKIKRRDISYARFLMTMILEPLIREAMKMGLDVKELFPEEKTKRKDLENLLESIPTLHTYHILNDARNTNSSRAIKANDLYDLSALNIAIPYCDVVVTEREWTKIAQQKGLDVKNETIITHNINDLVSLL